jgi:tetratricopeptide (TPR) repeat protein
VFAGGWTLPAAETVCSGVGVDRTEVLDLLTSLVDKSLVLMAERDGEARYRFLETIRQYGGQKLETSGETRMIRRAHARFMLALAERAERGLSGPGQAAWLERLELGLRLSGALGEFWHLRGYLNEGWRWMEAALANKAEATEPTRARALARAGWIAWEMGDYERSAALNRESLALSRKTGDKSGVALALYTSGLAEMHRNELERASTLIEQAVTLYRASEEDTAGLTRSLSALGMVAMVRSDYERAAALHEESLALARTASDAFAINISLILGANAYLGRGEHERAGKLCEEGLELSWRLRAMHATATYLNLSATLAGARGQVVRSARLWGTSETLREAIGAVLSPRSAPTTRPTLPPRVPDWSRTRGRRRVRRVGR